MKRLFCLGFALLAMAISPAIGQADLLFFFQESGGNVTMTSSGTFDTTGLPVVSLSTWGSSGVEENGNHDIMGGTDVGQVDISFGFNQGTDYSQWASANGPWTQSTFFANVDSGTRGFTTYVWDGVQVPGLGVVASDMNGALWTTDQNWTFVGESFASMGLIQGSYSVSDAVTGETITYLIGIPEPGSVGLIAFGLGFVALRRRNRK